MRVAFIKTPRKKCYKVSNKDQTKDTQLTSFVFTAGPYGVTYQVSSVMVSDINLLQLLMTQLQWQVTVHLFLNIDTYHEFISNEAV